MPLCVFYYGCIRTIRTRKDSLLMRSRTKTKKNKKYSLRRDYIIYEHDDSSMFPPGFFFRRFFLRVSYSFFFFFCSPVHLSRIDVPKNYGFGSYIYTHIHL